MSFRSTPLLLRMGLWLVPGPLGVVAGGGSVLMGPPLKESVLVSPLKIGGNVGKHFWNIGIRYWKQ